MTDHAESIRRAMHDALHKNPVGIKAESVAMIIGRDRSTVYSWGEGKAPPIDGLIQVVKLTKDLGPLMALAAACDCICLPIKCDIPSKRLAIQVLKEFSDLMQAYSSALADDTITQEELSRIKKAGTKAVAAIGHLMADTERVYQED